MSPRTAPELLAPAGSLDAVRAAVANGADAVYLGASRFNARDDGAQLSLDEVEQACQLAHSRGVRVYLTLNVLVKPAELGDALLFLGEAIDRGVDAAIVQDLGLVRLIQRVYPGFEVHGSTQMTVHDETGARVMHALGVERVVLARENTLDDVRAIRAAVPELGLETFVHGALCISYSGQCYMSGMISERSANRGSCAQSCRKDYALTDTADGRELDAGYLISAKDLAAHDHLADIAAAGVGCLKVEGRKKKPEYVATVTRTYRDFIDRVARGERVTATPDEAQPLVQIFSRGFTGGMYGGRQGRDYITRLQPDNRGAELGVVVGYERGELLVDLTRPVSAGDGLGFEPPEGTTAGRSTGFAVADVRTVGVENGVVRQAIASRTRVPVGWRVVRSAEAALLERARASYAALPLPARQRKQPLDVRVFGAAGAPLKAVFTSDGETVTVRSEATLAPASKRALDQRQLREQFGRTGETPFALANVDDAALPPGLFLPVSELNRMRQEATDELMLRRDWARQAEVAEREQRVADAVRDAGTARGEAAADVPVSEPVAPAAAVPPADLPNDAAAAAADCACDGTAVPDERSAAAAQLMIAEADGLPVCGVPDGESAAAVPVALPAHAPDVSYRLVASVFTTDDARAAAAAGATEVVLDVFLRHPSPPVSRVRALAEELRAAGVTLRLRTPTIVRPEERRAVDKWLALGLPLLSGHLGLVAEFGGQGRDVVADYAVNCFNQHTAAQLFGLGARRVTLSVELTADEMAEVAAPWGGAGFDVFAWGRPEGMTIEHCVLSAAFDRVPTTCRDLCVQKHPNVELTDPAGYTFPVATDSACRNRLLHSRAVDASEFLPRLWASGFRSFQLVFGVPGDPVAAVTQQYRAALDAVSAGRRPDVAAVRAATVGGFTRGHFARAV